MGRIKKHKPHRVRRPAPPALPADIETAKLFRSQCDDCGSRDLDWFGTSEALERFGDKAREALKWLGPNDAQGAAFWQCRSCDKFGAFGATHFGP